MLESIVHEIVLPHPPGKVWRALTESAALGRWLMPNDFEPRLGHAFTFRTDPQPPLFDGIVHCVVTELEEPRRLAYSWRGGPLEDTLVTYLLTPEGDGTRLRLEHSGFDTSKPEVAFTKQILEQGWTQAKFAERLNQVVAGLE
ncbi:MAG TPA: SRPBCC domain-containing protein [Dehalococcoidia bacterium]|nr:SRPBCC domain-containing protein [Dehalococcoidia bacterium]